MSLKYVYYTGCSKLLNEIATVIEYLKAVTPCVSGCHRISNGENIVMLSMLRKRLDVKEIYSSKAKENTFINCKRNKTEAHTKDKNLSCL